MPQEFLRAEGASAIWIDDLSLDVSSMRRTRQCCSPQSTNLTYIRCTSGGYARSPQPRSVSPLTASRRIPMNRQIRRSAQVRRDLIDIYRYPSPKRHIPDIPVLCRRKIHSVAFKRPSYDDGIDVSDAPSRLNPRIDNGT